MRRREEAGETEWVWRSGEKREAETVGREEWKWSMRVPCERMEFRDSVVTKIGDEAIGDKGREGLLGPFAVCRLFGYVVRKRQKGEQFLGQMSIKAVFKT